MSSKTAGHHYATMESAAKHKQPNYFYVPYSSEPQDGLKLVRLGRMMHSQLSQSNMESEKSVQRQQSYESNESHQPKSMLTQTMQSQQPQSVQSTESPQSTESQQSIQSQQPQYYYQQPQSYYQQPQSYYQQPQSYYQQPQSYYQQPQSVQSQQPQEPQYFYQQKYPDNYFIEQPRQHYLGEFPHSQCSTFQPTNQTQFTTCSQANSESKSDYFFNKFKEQQCMRRYFQALSLKQQKEMETLKKLLDELQLHVLRRHNREK